MSESGFVGWHKAILVPTLITYPDPSCGLVCRLARDAWEAGRAPLLALLREIEWRGPPTLLHPIYGTCLWCQRSENMGHAPDCRLAAVMGDER